MNAEDQNADGQPTSKSGPVYLGLSRCDNCYKHKAISWRGVDGESSSSAEDSGPEVESEEEEESSSSSSCSEKDLSEILEEPETEKPSPVSGDGEETLEAQEDKSSTKGVTRRAPLVKSFSLPATLTPHLIPLSLLPRPQTVVSTLHLQVEKHDEDAFHIVKQQLTEEERTEGGRGGINNQRSQPTLQQHQLSYQYQQQPPHQQLHQHQQHFPPLSAQGQMLPPALHTLPVLHHPALSAPQMYHHHSHPCLYCSSMQLPHSPYWSHCSNGQSHR